MHQEEIQLHHLWKHHQHSNIQNLPNAMNGTISNVFGMFQQDNYLICDVKRQTRFNSQFYLAAMPNNDTPFRSIGHIVDL